MSLCACGHSQKRHCDGIGRCDGLSQDSEYGLYRCVCPVWQPVRYCENRALVLEPHVGIHPRCAQPPGHDGPHRTTYGLTFNDKGETIP